jgi:hypothetical protein
MEKIQSTIIGASGIGLVETIPNLVPADLGHANGIVQIVVQILIGIVTLTGLLRKKRKQ